MDFIAGLVIDLVAELIWDMSTNSRLPRWVRYIAGGSVAVVYLMVIVAMLLMAVALFSENIVASILVVGLLFFMMVGTLRMFKKAIKDRS